MIFSSLPFMYFFLPALLIAFFIPKKNSTRRAALILFSLLFYAWGEPLYVFLMIFTVAFNYLFGLLISSYGKDDTKRKMWLIAAVAVNLGILSFYKYTGFAADTINSLFRVSIPSPELTMPIGISFFTFQAMSYVVDVYRGDTEVQRSFGRLLLYVSLFPQLIAGPIVRYKDIADELDDMRVRPYDLNDGIFRFSVGLAKKILIADNCAAAVSSLYGTSEITLLGRWMGALFFALQIYYDFSGYSDMAIGLGRMFGFKFLENFDHPYASSNATEFWRRWHMSLGTFFRDYVYIPLGGNRKRHIRNILVVWLLTGLWHGASWNFVLWGLFYGILLIFEKKFFLSFLEKLPKTISLIISRIYFIFITGFGFALFYFETDTFKSLGYLFGIGVSSASSLFTVSIIFENLILLAAGILFSYPVVPLLRRAIEKRFGVSYVVRRYYTSFISILLISVSTVRMVGDTYSPFLYWNF